MKRPAFQFYPADWRKDVELQSCSMAAQGLWINAMCIAHECEPYGHLTINSKAMTPAQLGRQVGLPSRECETLLAELLDAGVARKTDEGVIYSKRMVNDERLRNVRAEGGKGGSSHGSKGAEHGSKGGRPKANKEGLETPLKTPLSFNEEPSLKPPPSSSSSTSVSTEPKGSGGDPPVGNPVEKSKAQLWQAAVSLLAGQGMPEVQARTFIGGLKKTYRDEDIVQRAIEAAVGEQPADARAYIKATCQRLSGERSRSGAPDWTATAL